MRLPATMARRWPRPLRLVAIGALPLMLLGAGGNPSSVALDAFRSNIVSGGPPKDGIPSIDEPQFTSAGNADDFLDDGDIVLGVVRKGQARAYPRRILVHHEIVNDRLGGRNVAITYCPLTATAIGFFRGDTTFGVSGRLVNSNLVMYDRDTGSYWPQILGTAVKGPRKGQRLETLPVKWTTWEQWRATHPETEVLTRNTGYARDYSRDPYGSYDPLGGYYKPNSGLLFPALTSDNRLPNKGIVVAAVTPDGPVAIAMDRLQELGQLTFEVGGRRYLAVHDRRLEAGRMYRLDSDGELGDGPVTATPSGPRQDGRTLTATRVVTWKAFWFAWVGFYPNTLLRH